MKKDGTWGDHLILWAAVNCYATDVRVISSVSDHPDVILTPIHPATNTNPLVLGHIQEYHYVSLQRQKGKVQMNGKT